MSKREETIALADRIAEAMRAIPLPVRRTENTSGSQMIKTTIDGQQFNITITPAR